VNNYGLSRGEADINNVTVTDRKETGTFMAKYYAHTADLPDGNPDPDRDHWQTLSIHLRNVAHLAKEFAVPFGMAEESKLASYCTIYETVSHPT
jgi:hypothetical protein